MPDDWTECHDFVIASVPLGSLIWCTMVNEVKDGRNTEIGLNNNKGLILLARPAFEGCRQ